ncbi:MAG TPA: hypothetical protein VFR47_29445 [Anaerolineales bacterium]|nr:hypothetical protein [Anaerolineales bacterium]
MRPSLGAKSIFLFLLSLLFLFLLTYFESSLLRLSLTAEIIISGLLLIMPGSIGMILGAASLRRKELPRWVAILGILLNGLFAVFHGFVLSFAG